MVRSAKVAVVTGASRGIGAGIVQQFLTKGYRVVACSRTIGTAAQPNLIEVAGDISEPDIASLVIERALQHFGRVDTLVNNAGIFFTKAFTDYTAEAFKALSSTNLEGFLYVIIGTEAVTPAINIPINF